MVAQRPKWLHLNPVLNLYPLGCARLHMVTQPEVPLTYQHILPYQRLVRQRTNNDPWSMSQVQCTKRSNTSPQQIVTRCSSACTAPPCPAPLHGQSKESRHIEKHIPSLVLHQNSRRCLQTCKKSQQLLSWCRHGMRAVHSQWTCQQLHQQTVL
jgi:hypothetical protein